MERVKRNGDVFQQPAHSRFQEWTQAGVFEAVELALGDYDKLKGIDWSWQSMDGAMTKAPLGGEKTGPNPTDRAKKGVNRSLLKEARGVPIGLAIDGANRMTASWSRRR